MPFVVTEGAKRLWCGVCKKPTNVLVRFDRGVLRVFSRGDR